MSRKKLSVLDPVYATLGATQVTVLALRDLGAKKGGRTVDAADLEQEQAPLLAKLRTDAVDVARGAVSVPGAALGEGLARYGDLTERGRRAVGGVVPLAKRSAQEGEELSRSEQAKARREARRLARQAGNTARRGRDAAQTAAEEAGRVAERTLEVVADEAEQVVEAVRPRSSARPVRRPSPRRRAAVSDPAVSATNPGGGEHEAAERPTTSSVEAGASTTADRLPRARRARTTIPDASAATPGSPSPAASATAKKAARKRAVAPVTSTGDDQVTGTEATPAPLSEATTPAATTPARTTAATKTSTKKAAPKKTAPKKTSAKKAGAKKASATQTAAATQSAIQAPAGIDAPVPTPAELAQTLEADTEQD